MKIFAFLATNYEDSLSKKLFDKYVQAREKEGHEVKIQKMYEMDFNQTLEYGYKTIQPLEEDLVKFQENIKWSNHIAIFYPIWWGIAPAKFKAIIDRAFLPGFAFKFSDKGHPKGLLKGRTARVFATLNAPAIFYNFMPDKKIMKYILTMGGGIKSKFTYFGRSESLTEEQINKAISKVEKTI